MTTQKTTLRSRTIQWQDPAPGADAAKRMDGLDYLHAILRGDFPPPPMAALMGLELVDVEEGRAVFAATPAEHHYNPIGTVHGGLACTVMDSAMGCAVHSTLPAGAGYTTLDVKVNLLRPLSAETGRVICTATTVHIGASIALAEAKLEDQAGKLYAHATSTCMIFR